MIGTYKYWIQEKEDSFQFAITYYGQFYDIFYQLNAKGYVVSSWIVISSRIFYVWIDNNIQCDTFLSRCSHNSQWDYPLVLAFYIKLVRYQNNSFFTRRSYVRRHSSQ